MQPLRCVRFVAALVGVAALAPAVAGCGPRLRPDGCPQTFPQHGQACQHDPGHACFPPGSNAYACSCTAGADGRRVWSCESAGGPLAPPDLSV